MRSTWIHAGGSGFFSSLPQWAAACAAALALCAVTTVAIAATPTPFEPPAGWTPVRPPAGILGVWVHAGDREFQQNMVVGRERTSMSASDFDDRTIKDLKRAMPGFQLGADQYTTTCNGLPAHYISYSVVANGRQLVYEHMTRVYGGYAWFAIYARASTQPSLPEARSALTTLCGGDISTPPPQVEAPQTVPQTAPTGSY